MSRAAKARRVDGEQAQITIVCGSEKVQSPTGLAIGGDGCLYVADSGNHRVAVFTPDGTLVRQWGRNGKRPGQFGQYLGELFVSVCPGIDERVVAALRDVVQIATFPPGLAAICGAYAGEELVFVLDKCNARIQVFATNGRFIRAIPVNYKPNTRSLSFTVGYLGGLCAVVIPDASSRTCVAVSESGVPISPEVAIDYPRNALAARLRMPEAEPFIDCMALGPGGDLTVIRRISRLEPLDSSLFGASHTSHANRICLSSKSECMKPFPLPPDIGRVSSLTANDDGTLYVCNGEGGTIFLVGRDGTCLRRIKVIGDGCRYVPHVFALAKAASGELYVADAQNNCIFFIR